jgi:hypothetical protein
MMMVVVVDGVMSGAMTSPMVRRPAVGHLVMGPMVDDVVAVVVVRGGRGAGGAKRQGGGRGEGQGDQFHGLHSQVPAPNHPIRSRG